MRLLRLFALILFISLTVIGPVSGQTNAQIDSIVQNLDRGEYDKTIALCREYLAGNPRAVRVIEYEVSAGFLCDSSAQYVAAVMENNLVEFEETYKRLIVSYYKGGYNRAKIELDRIERRFKPDAWTLYWKARLMRNGESDSLAFEYYRQSAENEECQPLAWRGLYYLYRERGLFDQADSVLNLLAADRYEGKWALAKKAYLVGLRGDWESALSQMAEIAKKTKDLSVYSEWTETLTELGYFDRAEKACREALEFWPKNKYLHRRLIWIYDEVGRITDAIELAEKLNPTQSAFLRVSTLMNEAFDLNDTAAIEARCNELIDADIGYTYPMRRYIDWLDRRGRSEDAKAIIYRLIMRASSETRARVIAARTDEDYPARALAVTDTVVQDRRYDPIVYDRIRWMMRAGRSDEARQLAEWLIETAPGELYLILSMIRTEYLADNLDGAKVWLARAEKLVPGSASVLEMKMWLTHEEHNRAEALSLLDSLSGQYPAWSDLMWYYRDILDDEDSVKMAEVVTRFSQYPGTSADFIEELAICYARIERYETADSILAEGLVRHPQAADLYYHRGIIHDWAGNNELAAKYYGMARSLDPANVAYGRGTIASTSEAQPLLEFTGRQKIDSTGLVLLSVDSVLALAKTIDSVKADYGGVQFLDKRQIIFKSESRRLRRQHRLVKVVSERAHDYYGTESIHFNAWNEMPYLVMARVIHPDGSVIDVKPSDVVVTGSSGAYNSDSRNVTWNYPRLDSGSVIEYIMQFQLGRIDAFDIGYGYIASDWDPVRNWSVELQVPDSWDVIEHHTEGLAYRTYDSSGTNVQVWAADSVGMLVDQDAMPNIWDQGEWLRFAYKKSWPEVAQRYWARVKEKFEVSDKIKELAGELTKGKSNRDEKLAALYDYVAREIRYEAVEFGEGGTIPRIAEQVLSNRYGDCKDKATLLITLLDAVGIKAHPALIFGYDTVQFVRSVPDDGYFTHMIVYLPDFEEQFVDPTCAACRAFDIDVEYMGKPTLIIGSDLDDPLIMTPEPVAADKQYHRYTTMTVKDDGILELVSTIRLQGQTALNWKQYYRGADSSEIAGWIKQYSGIGFWTTVDFDNYKLNYDATQPGLEFGWTSKMNLDSLFIKQAQQVMIPLWFYSVGDYLTVPDTTDRKLDAIVGQRFKLTDKYVMIFGDDWELNNYRVSWTMDTTWFAASSKAEEFDDSVVVTVSFELKTPRVSLAELPAFSRAVDLVQSRVMRQAPIFRPAPDLERIAAVETALAANPTDMSLIMTLPQLYLGADLGGQRCEARERRGKVRAALAEAMNRGLTNETLMTYLSSLLAIDGMAREADSLLRAYEAQNQLSVLLETLLAGISFALADYTDAEQRFLKVMQQAPSDALRLQLSNLYVLQGNYVEAKKQIDLLEMLRADSVYLMGAELQYYLALDSLDIARNLIEHWPDTSQLALSTATTLLHEFTGEYEKAYETFYAMYQKDPDNAMNLNNCAWFLALAEKDLDRALEMVGQSMILTGNCLTTDRNTYGLVLLKLGRIDEARAEFEWCLAREETAESVTINCYFLAQCALAENNTELARTLLARAAQSGGDVYFTRKAKAALEQL